MIKWTLAAAGVVFIFLGTLEFGNFRSLMVAFAFSLILIGLAHIIDILETPHNDT